MHEKILWFLSGATGIIILGLIAQPEFSSQPIDSSIAPTIAAESALLPFYVRVEVLNGCGVSQVAARLTRKARQMGIDVIHEGNADHFGYLHTLVIRRGGDRQRAEQVAQTLGIPHLVDQQTDEPFRLADITIVIGQDYERIDLFGERAGERKL